MAVAFGKRSIQSQAVCESQYAWMNNSMGQPPCIVASYLLGQCGEGTWVVEANTDPNYHYNTPDATTANQCSCSWSAYNSLQACALCQIGTTYSVSTWTQWSTNCSGFSSSPSPWPKSTVIPEETAIPFWAATDPNTWTDAKFNGPAAQGLASEGKPDITNRTFNTSSSSSKSSSTNVGAIAGGVAAGALLIALIGLLVFYLRCKRSSANRRRAHGETSSGGGWGASIPGLGYFGRRDVIDREFTSPLMSGMPDSRGVTLTSYSPGLTGVNRSSMFIAPGAATSPVPMPTTPPGIASMPESPMSRQGTLSAVSPGMATLGGVASVIMAGAGGGMIPNSPLNPSIVRVSFASMARHGHTVSNASNMSTIRSGHRHSQSNSGSMTSPDLPEGTISPFIMPSEESDASSLDNANDTSANASKAGAPNSFAHVTTSMSLRKPHERKRMNPPAYSPTASPQENMFSFAQQSGQSRQGGPVRVRSASTATASNEATGVGGHSHSDATVAMSGTTLVGGGGGTIRSVNTRAGSAEEGGGSETLAGSGENGSVRSPNPFEEEGEGDDLYKLLPQ